MKSKKWVRIVCLAIAILMIFGVAFASLPIFAQENEGSDEQSSEAEQEDASEDEEYTPEMFLPEDMRAAVVTPGVDFWTDSEQSREDTLAEIDAMLDDVLSLQMNTVIVETVVDGTSYYDTDINASVEEDILSVLLEKTREIGLYVFFTFDIYHAFHNATTDSDYSSKADYIVAEAHKFARKYPVDGVVLSGYYAETGMPTYNTYKQNGGGMGYENWLMEYGAYMFETVSDVLHLTSNVLAVGLYIDHVWANGDAVEGGSETSDSFQALVDGYADTKAYLEQGLTDFVLLYAQGSITDSDVPFKELVDWWSEVAQESDSPLYVMHDNDKLCTTEPGWAAEDQILHQLLYIEDNSIYQGSAFASLGALLEDRKSSTSALMEYYNGNINEEALFEELDMTAPTALTYTTLEPTAIFAGTFDENFDVYFNGEKIVLNEAGRFYFNMELDYGLNTFTISHKDKTFTYRITRRIEPLYSISPENSMTVDGGSSINITAIAYEDAKVTATLAGKTITLSPVDGQVDGIAPNSSYIQYKGTYQVPAGIVGQAQDLGSISVLASYMGFEGTALSGNITVAAEVDESPNGSAEFYDESSVGTGEVVATLDPVVPAGEQVKLVRTTSSYTDVYDPQNYDPWPWPSDSTLPLGTLAYYERMYQSNEYLTKGGDIVRTSQAEVYTGESIGENALNVLEIGARSGETIFKIALDKKIAMNVQPSPVAYASDYSISSFNATEVHVVFDNVTSVTKLPSFENSPLFKSGEWDTVVESGITKFRLVLQLRYPGVYNGCNVYYDDDDNLILEFARYYQSLSGMTIVIDPGHGYTGTYYDPGAVGEIKEVDANLAIAKLVESKLKAAGANVIRFNVESTHYVTANRAIIAQQYNPDIYLSIHCNASTSSSAYGTETYYFTPFSQPLAESISNNLASYWSTSVYKDGKNYNRGDQFYKFVVTRQHSFASVLIETGFVTNKTEAMALANSTHQDGFANAIVAGVKEYLSRSPISGG